MKKCYALECDGRAYCINSINDHVVCIGARILANKVVRKNCPIQCNSRVVACAKLCARCTNELVTLSHEPVGRERNGSVGRKKTIHI